MLSSILLIRGFFCFIINFWCTKISSYKFWNNILFSLIFFSNKKAKKFKTVILSHIQKKKNCYSHHPFVFKYLITICICYLFEFKYFNHLYKKKNAKLFLPKNVKRLILSHVQKKKKKKLLFSPLICIQMSDSYLYVSSICIQILQLFLPYIYTHTHTIKLLPKKKKLTTTCKNY